MESLEVITRPHFDKDDEAWLVDIRSRRAENRGPPYFTLVFSGVDMDARAFAERIRPGASGPSIALPCSRTRPPSPTISRR